MAYKGIDLSNWNGTIDFAKAKADGVQFVMVRGGWSTSLDPKAEEYLKECNRLGIPCGIYWFSYALNEADARREALACLTLAGRFKLEYPIAYDFEDDSVAYAKSQGVNMTKELATKIVNAFIKEIVGAGYYAVNYANPNFLTNYFGVVNAPLWLAAWYISAPDRNCQMWQYSSTGAVKGISGNVDMNLSYVDFPTYLKKNGYNHLEADPWWEQASPWAKEAVDWAVKNDILHGYGNDNYALQKNVTREQMCVFLKRYDDYRKEQINK